MNCKVLLGLGLVACGGGAHQAPPPSTNDAVLARLAAAAATPIHFDTTPATTASMDEAPRGSIQVRITASGGADPYALTKRIVARQSDVITCFDRAGLGDEGFDLTAVWAQPGQASVTGSDSDTFDRCLGDVLAHVGVILDPVAEQPATWPITVELEIDRIGAP